MRSWVPIPPGCKVLGLYFFIDCNAVVTAQNVMPFCVFEKNKCLQMYIFFKVTKYNTFKKCVNM
jgi:hypothetical protein